MAQGDLGKMAELLDAGEAKVNSTSVIALYVRRYGSGHRVRAAQSSSTEPAMEP